MSLTNPTQDPDGARFVSSRQTFGIQSVNSGNVGYVTGKAMTRQSLGSFLITSLWVAPFLIDFKNRTCSEFERTALDLAEMANYVHERNLESATSQKVMVLTGKRG